MSRIIDRTRQAMGWQNPFQKRAVSKIKRIVVHHSATASGSMATFENTWRNLGWRNGGYNEIILLNGDVEVCYPATVVTNGAGVWNPTSYHICIVGNYRKNGAQPSTAQMQSLLNRIRHNMGALNVPVQKVKGHKELMPTICPGMSMTNLRDQLRTPPTNNTNTHTVARGETLSGIAQHHGTTTAVLQNLNSIANANQIRVGQVLRLPAVNQSGVTTGSVNLRRGAGTNHSIIRLLPRNVNLTIASQVGNWLSVQVGNDNGWVHADFVRIGGSAPTTVSITELARQVIAGQWGSGADRTRRLTDAGHNANAVQAEVNRLLR